MNRTQINDHLSIADQPDVATIGQLAAKGFKTLINVRPDGESADQPGNEKERQAAEAAGVAYSFIPVTGKTITRADIDAFGRSLGEADGPVLAHCRTGVRALTLFTLSEVLSGRMTRDEIPALGSRHGYDLSSAIDWLKAEVERLPRVWALFDEQTSSVQYVVSDPATRRCAIIDPVLDFDPKSGATGTKNADAILAHVEREGLVVEWILDTHPHADHFSAAQYLKGRTGAPTAIGERVTDVQKLWADLYDWPELATDGSQWDRLFRGGETFKIGTIEARVMHSPGHTLASITYVIGDAAFVHDTLFMPDGGTARADFPGGDARTLWRSLMAILELPEATRLFTGHDYQPAGRAPKWETTVGEQRRANAHIASIDEDEFVRRREARDATLPMPQLLLHSLQVNIAGGRLPEPHANGLRYLRFPLDALESAAA